MASVGANRGLYKLCILCVLIVRLEKSTKSTDNFIKKLAQNPWCFQLLLFKKIFFE